jgi:hypothetical protein
MLNVSKENSLEIHVLTDSAPLVENRPNIPGH